MGLALKTLHDFAAIDDTTPSTPRPAPAADADDDARTEQQAAHPAAADAADDAPNYWQGGSLPTRLAAYYEVAATLLEPDETKAQRPRAHGRAAPFVRGRPFIEGARNRIAFTSPATSRRARSSARPPSSVRERLEVLGNDLKGDRTQLLLAHADFAEPMAVDAPWSVRLGVWSGTDYKQHRTQLTASITNPQVRVICRYPGSYRRW